MGIGNQEPEIINAPALGGGTGNWESELHEYPGVGRRATVGIGIVFKA